MSWIFKNDKSIKAVTVASSTNGLQNRTYNPIDFNSDDRWCSAALSIKSPQWWAFSLINYKVKISKYLVSAGTDHAPQQWQLEAFSDGEWKLLQNISKSDLEVSQIKTFNIEQDIGYYSTFRLWSDQPTQLRANFHFCIMKFDMIGKLIRIKNSISTCEYVPSNYFVIAFLFT